MRTLLTGEFNVAMAGDTEVDLYVKLEVQNASGTWKDVGASLGSHWIINAKWGETLDTKVAQATFELMMKVGTASLAPLISASVLNVDDAAAYAPLLNIGRLIRMSTATMPRGTPLDTGKYRLMFTGRIDNVDQADSIDYLGPITLACSDLGGWLMDLEIESPGTEYGNPSSPPALEDVLQSLIDDNIAAGDPAVTLVKESSSSFAVTHYKQGDGKLLEALDALLLDTTGEDIRYRFDASHVSQLTWFDPDRSRVTVDATFTAQQYVLRKLDIALANVRNVGTLVFSGGLVHASNATSIAQYRRRFFRLPANPLVKTTADAQAVIDAVVNDLSEPLGEAAADCPYLWFVQLYDRYTFDANDRQYDDDQTFAVSGYQHEIQSGIGSTTLTLSAQIVGAYARWLRRIGQPVNDIDPSVQLNNWKWTDSADGLSRTYTMTVGTAVHRVTVFVNTVLSPPLTDPWPPSADDLAAGVPAVRPTDVLTPDPATRLVTYTVTKPSAAYQKYVQFDSRLGDFSEGESKRNVLDPAPAALTGTLHGVRTGASADLSANVQAGTADWPVLVEFIPDSPFGAVLASTSISANATLDKNSSGLAALGGVVLPQRELRRFFGRLTNVAGEVKWMEPIAVDRDPLPAAWVTINDYRAAPSIKVNYDSDTDEVKITIPGGKVKTFSGLVGAGVVTYTVGDATDDASVESALVNDESRSGYQVDIKGGGTYLTAWGGVVNGVLHGETTGPSLTVTVTPFATTADIAYSGTGVITYSIDGGSYSTPPASPITGIARHATVDHTYSFKSVQAGQTVTDTVVIPSLQSDAVTPDLVVTPGTPTTTTQPYTVVATNPRSGGAAPTITVTPYNCTMTIAGVDYTTAQTISSGTVVTGKRPTTITDTQAHIGIVASIASAGSEAIDVEIISQLNFGPTLVVTATPGASAGSNYSLAYSGSGTITLSIDGGSYSSPAASPIAVTPHATIDHVYTFKAVLDGQTIIDSVVIPSVQSDSVTPNLQATPGTPTTTTQPYAVAFSSPRSTGAAPTAFAQVFGSCSMTISGTTYVAADGGISISSGTTVTANRAASTTTTKDHIRFHAGISGGGSEELIYTVPPQLNLGPSLTVTPTPGDASYSLAYTGTGTITYSVDGGSYSTPGGSPITATRDSNDHTYTFKAVLDGQTITASVTVPAVQTNTGVGITSVTVVENGDHPCDGGGSLVVNWTTAGLPNSGVTFDVFIEVLAGTRGAHSQNSTGKNSGDTCNIDRCADSTGQVTVTAHYSGSIIAVGSQTF